MEVYGKMAAPFDTGLTDKNKLVTELEKAEREDRELMEAMKASRAKIALIKANADIERLRRERDAVEALEEAKYDTEINRLIALRHDVRVKREALRRGERDGELTAVSVARAADFVVADRQAQPVARVRPEGEKRVRNTVTRPPLCSLITERLNFRWVGYTCNTDNGKDFIEPDGTVFRSLNAWAETIIERGGGGGRKVSVYEVVDVQNNTTEDWKNWGEVYSKDCTSLNF